jgi:DNA-binding NarL/FixJ family response regulator
MTISSSRAQAEREIEFSTLWSRLADGSLRVAASYFTESRSSLELEEGCPSTPPSRTDLEVLESILLGECQKVIAIDRDCSIATVAAKARRCLKSLGLNCSVSGLPPLLVSMYRAHRKLLSSSNREAVETRWLRDLDGARILVTLNLPSASLRQLFSSAECDVIRLLMLGMSQQEMARWRGTSCRTIANQVASAYLKAQVSGRLALVGALLANGDVRPTCELVHPSRVLRSA